MRIVVLIPNLNAPSELALNRLMRRKDLEIVGVVRSDVSPLRRQYWKYMIMGVGKAGVFYGALIALTAYLHLIGLGIASLLWWNRRRKWLSPEKLAKKHGIPLYDVENINTAAARKVISSWEPDIMVSVYFDQILKQPVLDIPKVAALNMHPGLLPNYRGLWPNFWKLHNKEKYAGVSIHYMKEEIDAGDVIAQTKFLIKPSDTKFCLGLRTAQKGTKLLISTLQKIKKGVKLKPIRLKGPIKYYSLPQKAHFEAFHAQGRKMFSLMRFRQQLDQYY